MAIPRSDNPALVFEFLAAMTRNWSHGCNSNLGSNCGRPKQTGFVWQRVTNKALWHAQEWNGRLVNHHIKCSVRALHPSPAQRPCWPPMTLRTFCLPQFRGNQNKVNQFQVQVTPQEKMAVPSNSGGDRKRRGQDMSDHFGFVWKQIKCIRCELCLLVKEGTEQKM